VKTDVSLSVKRCTVAFTSQLGNFDIKVQECEDSESEIELIEIAKTLKIGGQATVDNLKELNLRTTEESHPI